MPRLGNVQSFWITALSLLTGLLYPLSVSSRYSSLSDPTLAYATLLPKTPPVASPFTHSKSQGPTMAKGQTLPATTPPVSSSPPTLSSLYSATIVRCCSSKAPTQSLGTHTFPGFGTEHPRSQISHPQGLLPCCFWVSAQISPR